MAENLGELPRNPSIKRSWLDVHAADEPEHESNDTDSYQNYSQAVKRCRESSTDIQGTDTGYASSSFSEAQSDNTPFKRELDGDPENGADSNTGDEGLWFKVKGKDSTVPSNDPNPSSSTDSMTQRDESHQPKTKDHITKDHPKVENGDTDNDGADDEDDEDNVSEISGLSDMSLDGEGWRPMAGPMSWVHQQMLSGANPRVLLRRLLPDCTDIPDSFDDLSLWKVVVQILSEPPRRKKLPDVSTIGDVISLMKSCKKIMVLTGAGVSVSCGIPDFRSRDGVYARLAVEYPDLPDPQAMFDISYFLRNPKPFFKFAKELYPGQFKPSPSHRFIQLIEKHGKLLRNYTQNIDTLEQVAGITRVLQCHGSFATATCLKCKHQVDAEAIREDIMNQVIPHCPRCPAEDLQAIMKPDIVFFGESLPNEFHRQMEIDKDDCDLLIVIGSSLKVRPVALMPNSLPAKVPQILINREPLKHLTFDVELLGDCDVIVNELCHRLGPGWESVCSTSTAAQEISRDEMVTPVLSTASQSPMRVTPSIPVDKTPEEQSESGEALPNQAVDVRLARSPRPLCDSDSSQESEAQSAAPGVLVEKEESFVSALGFHHVDSCSNMSVTGRLESTHLTASTSSLAKMDSLAATEGMESSLGNTSNNLQTSHDEKQTLSASGPPTPPPNHDQQAAVLDSTTQEMGDSSSPVREEAAWTSGGHGGKTDSPHSEKELEELRSAWQPKLINLASRLKENTFLFLSPNRYVFSGAEVYDDDDDDEDDDGSSSSSSYADCRSDISSGNDRAKHGSLDSPTENPADLLDLDKSGERHFGVFSSSGCSDGSGDGSPNALNASSELASPHLTNHQPVIDSHLDCEADCLCPESNSNMAAEALGFAQLGPSGMTGAEPLSPHVETDSMAEVVSSHSSQGALQDNSIDSSGLAS